MGIYQSQLGIYRKERGEVGESSDVDKVRLLIVSKAEISTHPRRLKALGIYIKFDIISRLYEETRTWNSFSTILKFYLIGLFMNHDVAISIPREDI